ncbi:MAG TPA: AmmeMemoRadiSam system protein B [Bryobacteraceae bacterium]|jgi:AmmeMemoRadiSam system protein B/AmmeMemoRadiSam system protein A|nr:AmmeMemoRadiSam system protein B [Bryobacteraceae bacterium]
MQAVHVSPYGGAWYPDCRTDLELLLDDLFETSQQRTGAFLFPNPLGFVVPHAGLQYSGAVAAAAYRHVRRQQPRRAVVLGFAHKGGPPGISIPDISKYETPLGEVRVDRDTMERLARYRPFHFVDEDRICDHSVEIQLPLLQHAAPRALAVPLFAGYVDDHERDAAAEMLAALCGPDTVFLVSSDLTHYGRAFGYQPFPADSKISARLAHLDRSLTDAAASLDARYFLEEIEKTRATLCGRSPIALWLRTLAFAAGDEIFQETLDYQTSGDITGDYDHTVSYGALGYFPVQSFWVDAAERSLLLESARETLRLLRSTGEHRAIPPREITPALSRKAGVFVGLHQGLRLLGCVGNRMSCQSLAENVAETTLRAALDDPRFPTVLSVDGEIEIEISILSPMKPIRDMRAFRVGVHGATLDCGGRQALLLPQVAAGRDWNGEQFLSSLSIKAGLGTKGYQSLGARLSVFQAQVFAM